MAALRAVKHSPIIRWIVNRHWLQLLSLVQLSNVECFFVFGLIVCSQLLSHVNALTRWRWLGWCLWRWPQQNSKESRRRHVNSTTTPRRVQNSARLRIYLYTWIFVYISHINTVTFATAWKCGIRGDPPLRQVHRCVLHNEATKGWHSAVPRTTSVRQQWRRWRHVAADHDYYSKTYLLHAYIRTYIDT